MNATGNQAPIAVALCDGLATPDGRSEPAAICTSLERACPDVHAEVVPDLCRKAERGSALAVAVGASRLVLGVCDNGISRREVQRRARRAGLDPFAVELVRLPESHASEHGSRKPVLRLAAAVARVRAFAGTRPEQMRPRLLVEETAVSRRSLVTLPPITYEPVAGVENQHCLGADSCHLCVQACPQGALAIEDGCVVVDRQCQACGLCLPACPAGAVGLPGASLAQYQAQLDVLLDSDEPALLFYCERTAAALRGAAGGWLPVEVPCLGMVTAGWILQALAGGASTVGLAACREECRSFQKTALEDRLTYTRDLLRLLGDRTASNRVQLIAAGDDGLEAPPRPASLPAACGTAGTLSLAEPAATATALLRLGEAATGAREYSLAHPASPLGLVHLRADACTCCGGCAAACPTGALRLEESGEKVVLSYDAAACLGCGRCARSCPETATRVLHVERTTDLAALASGRMPLKVTPLVRCPGCGGPIAPQHLIERVRELLEEQAEPLFRVLDGLCAGCRGAALARARHQAPVTSRSDRFVSTHRPLDSGRPEARGIAVAAGGGGKESNGAHA